MSQLEEYGHDPPSEFDFWNGPKVLKGLATVTGSRCDARTREQVIGCDLAGGIGDAGRRMVLGDAGIAACERVDHAR